MGMRYPVGFGMGSWDGMGIAGLKPIPLFRYRFEF